MKKAVNVIFLMLTLAAVLFVISCNDTPSDITPEITGSENEGDSNSQENTEKIDEEIRSLKNEVIALVNEDEQTSPTDIFENFFGDYSIPTLVSDDIECIWQRNGVTVVEYKDGNVDYTLARNGYLASVRKYNGKSKPEVMSLTPLTSAYLPSIFTDFGINIGEVYSGAGSGEEMKDPELTEDMLTITEDRKLCTFSLDYLKKVGQELVAALALSEADSKKFTENFSGKGEYSFDEKLFTFELSGETDAYGKISINLSQGYDGGECVSMSTRVAFAMKMEDGSEVSTANEMEITDVKYKGDEIVSVVIATRLTVEYELSGSTMLTVSEGNYRICYGDENEPNGFTAENSNKTVIKQGTNEQLQTKKTVLSLVGDKMSASMTTNGVVDYEMKGEGVVFKAPSDKKPPDSVNKVVSDAISDAK